MKRRLLLLSACLAFSCAQAASPGKETTALFTYGGFYTSLGKRTKGDPAEWYSNVIFEKMDKAALGVRKVCREGRDG
ncbi:hypothetical protein [Janthinobacterium sp. LB3P112]|uniref:hypothetical protein n=1 Tax=Janthinobacterium sp. LB3P112 TaxID=3424196 RepID=UPI003F27CCBB